MVRPSVSEYCYIRHPGTTLASMPDTTPSGWVPASVSPESKRTRRAGRSRSEPASRGGNRAAESKRKQEKECWRVKKRLDKLEWRMRRGYKAGKGPGLRRQRQDYEDYLRKFC